MTSVRPILPQIQSEQRAWDADVETMRRQAFEVALPVPEYPDTGSLPPASTRRGCLVSIGSTGTGTTMLLISDGTDWREITIGSAI